MATNFNDLGDSAAEDVSNGDVDQQYDGGVYDNDKDLNANIQQIAKELSADWQIGDWVVVVYNTHWYPRIVQDVIILYYTLLIH